MKILILYFSGTGNTKFIAEKISENLSSMGYNHDLKAVENFRPKKLKKYDILIFGFPVYAHDLPLFLKNYVQKLSLPKSKGVILYATKGKKSGNALRRAAKLLRKSEFIPLYTAEFLMPSNDILLAESKDSAKVTKILAANFADSDSFNKVTEKIAEKAVEYAKKDLDTKDINFPSWKFTASIVDPTIQIIFKLLKKILISKLKTDKNCNLCGYCEKICPADNIVIKEGEVEFLDKCYLCLRCINQCPEEAIQISKLTKNKFRYQGPNENYKPKILEK